MPLNAMTRGALAKLDAMLRQKGLMAATLFRDRTYNTSYDAGDDLLDAVEFKGILDKAGVALSAADARAMLAAARRKPLSTRVDFLHGDAMDPQETAGVTPHFDGIFMAYGIRNVSDPDLCLQRLQSLLRPGGTICFHEYSVADTARSRLIWNAVTLGVIIPMGMVTARRSPIYRYLRRSVLEFDGVAAFEERLGRAGFVNVHTLPLGGWQRGIVHSFLASRPG